MAALTYSPLPRPTGTHSPASNRAAYSWGEACGRLGLGIPDFAIVTGQIHESDVWEDTEEAIGPEASEEMKRSRWRCCCAGHRVGRRAAGLPALTNAQRREEEGIARRAS